MVDDNINEEVELCVAIEEPLFVDDDTSVNSHAARFGAVENSCLLSDDSSNEEAAQSEKSSNCDSDNQEDITWITCAGQLRVLSQLFHQCENILNEVIIDNDRHVNAKRFSEKVKHIAKKIQDLSVKLVKNCSIVINKAQRDEIEIGCPVLEENTKITSRDPSERPRDMNDDQRKFLMQQRLCQPRLKSFPVNETKAKNRPNKFNASWYDSFPHLEYSQKENKAYCFVCSLFPSGPGREKSDPAWINGVRSWKKMRSVGANKKGKLHKHFSSKSHQAALADFARFSITSGHIDVMMNAKMKEVLIQEKADEEKNKEIMLILLDVARTLARQSLAFRGGGDDKDGNFIQIVNLLSRHCPVLKLWLDDQRLRPYSTTYTSSEAQNEMLHLLAQSVRDEIRAEIKSAGVFSVSADTTPDTSNQDKLIVAVRYVNQMGIPCERLVEMKETLDKTGAGTAKDVIKSLMENEIDIDMLAFQTYDFTTSMFGRLNGAQKVLQEILKRQVPYIPCQGHRSNTFNEHCCKHSSIITSMYDALEDVYVFFSKSTKRNKIIEESCKDVENNLKFRNLSKTRWVYNSESIDAVWRSYEVIPNAIVKVINARDVESKVKAKGDGIKKKFFSFDFLFALMFMRIIMTKTKILTKQLQQEELNIVDALNLIDATVKNLRQIRSDENGLDSEIEAMVAFGTKVGIDVMAEYTRHHRSRKPPKRINEYSEITTEISFKDFYRKEMYLVLDSLITEYTDNVKDCIDKIKPLGESLQLPLERPMAETVNEMCSLFPLAVKDVNAEILLSELEIFNNIVSSQLKSEPKSLQDVALFAFKHKNVFPTVCKAYQLLLTAPVSVEKDERCFSKLKIVKNCLRSTMKDTRLNDLIVLACEKDLTDNVDLNIILKNWATAKMRKLPLKI
ncbi:zinc finger MYM-type protein 1-like [Xenia sp. Carnegie-2017]|uniref:zinc finger MYM-type protein 1-like n=1 Tax=Xenia sp. Carnegie-2017 TaxID=2897299 RepID=UPI001F036FE9|nr:zinc finger MYM-type protein 1-like [Xenia sp. Carnegie-2017]